jgi:uncharacterized protein
MPRIRVHAKPGSRTESVEVRSDGVWIVRVRPPAVDGRANERIREMLAEFLNCRRLDVTLVSGPTARLKIFEVPRIPA